MGHRISQFLRFCIVGSVAFIVDFTTLELLLHFVVHEAFIARIVSIAIGMHVAYALNLVYTYRYSPGHSIRVWIRYLSSNSLGALINYLLFVLLLGLLPFEEALLNRMIAITVGTGVALFFNYWSNQRFVFQDKAP